MITGSKVLLSIIVLIAAAATLNASVVVNPVFVLNSGLEFSIAETPFTPQLDSPLAHLDLIPTATTTPAPVMNLDPRSVVLGPTASYAAPRIRVNTFSSALFEVSALSLVALNIVDYFSTREALRYPGLQEGNPLLKNIVKDPTKFAVLKIGVVAASYISMKSLYKKNRTLAWVVSTASNVLMGYVVSNNVRLINVARSRQGL